MKAKEKKLKKKKTGVRLPIDKHIDEQQYCDEKGMSLHDDIDRENTRIFDDNETMKKEQEDEFDQ